MELVSFLYRWRDWSRQTFGPEQRVETITNHIRKELIEVEAAPSDLEEWIDVVQLALDGAWRTGATPEQIAAALEAKFIKNRGRVWPDWRTIPVGQPIEHQR